MLSACKVSLSRVLGSGEYLLLPSRLYRTTFACHTELANKPKTETSQREPNQAQVNNGKVLSRVMEFFDLKENWGKKDVISGRSWRIDELRIKSNEDLHKLWFILYKERNMLLTMRDAAKDACENMPSPERLDKVEESMKLIEEVVQERNKAYWELEVGDSQYVARRRAFRKDPFGRWRWIACSEHLIPVWMNAKWRAFHGPGSGPDVVDFNRKLREQKQNSLVAAKCRHAFKCRQLMKRFPTLDLDYLQELYPSVNVKFIKSTLNEHCLQDRTQRFHSLFYDKKKTL